MDAVIIRVIDLPHTCKGFTSLDSNGDFNIYLNARLSSDQQAATMRHEIEHIGRGHFYRPDESVDILEQEASC